MATENKTKKPASKTTSVKKPASKTTSVKKPTTKKKTPAIKKNPVTKKKSTTSTSKPKVSTIKKKPAPKKKKPEPRMTEVLEKVMKDSLVQKDKPIKRKKGKVFYLVFSIIFYAGAFFYINNILYDNKNLLESALFAFAALFVVFVLLQFNVHMIFVNFFRLPFKYLWDQTKMEIKKEVELDEKAHSSKFPFRRYKALFTLTIYTIIILLLVGSQIYNGIIDGDKVLLIITQSSLTLLVFLIIVCSWQYLFNILPEVLDKSIDAKNGFILTLSAAVMIIYLIFNIFDIIYLAEMMIFILIIGFIALLGVNLNMIVGEINIFQNLKQRHSKTVTRVVFMIFFSFHLYVILYASVVAYSIYRWEPETYNFSYEVYEYEQVPELYDGTNNVIQEVYYPTGTILTTVYDIDGRVITEYLNEDGYPISPVYDITGARIMEYYDVFNHPYNPDWSPVYDEAGMPVDTFYFNGTTLVGVSAMSKGHDYGDFLYYTVVTVSTLGYGDITPSTEYGIAQAWGGFLSIYGFTFFALSISFVSNIAIEGATSTREEDEND
ncbi:MAG: Ion channel [Candidatus Izimaplasma bacterium HR2]|nr:MAG: Ion channel [Candidatus Izimaplasma bacterium HR2]